MGIEPETIGSVTYHSLGDEECSICYEPVKVDQRRSTHNDCGKVWHEDCFLSWVLRPKRGSCPNCRGTIYKAASQSHYDTVMRAARIIQREHGTWKHGIKGYLKSGECVSKGVLRPFPVNDRTANILSSSDHHIPLRPLPDLRIILYRQELLFRPLGGGGLDILLSPPQQALLDYWISRAPTNQPGACPSPYDNSDSGWRILFSTLASPGELTSFLVYVLPSRRNEEESAWHEHRSWEDRGLYEMILNHPGPLWSLEDYDEAYVLQIDPFELGELFKYGLMPGGY